MERQTSGDHGVVGDSIARVIDPSSEVVGAGFLIGGAMIATCAHVVTAAVGGRPDQSPPPPGELTVDFPMLASTHRTRARVHRWWPIDEVSGTGDVAILRLAEAPPPPARMPPLLRPERLWGHRFRVLGFPLSMQDGVWSAGEFRDVQGTRWLQLQGAPHGQAVVEGFSGSPV